MSDSTTVTDPVVQETDPTPAPVAPKPAIQTDDPAALKEKLELVMRDNREKGETNARLAKELSKLKGSQQQQPDGPAEIEFKSLWDDAKKTNEALRAELASVKEQLSKSEAAIQQERIDMKALNEISAADAINPEQLQQLLRGKIKAQDGKPVALNGGVEQSLAEYLDTLRQPGSGYEHHFRSSGVRGMGVNPASPGGGGAVQGGENPFITGNLTEQIKLESADPIRAKALQAEAMVFKARK
jgi:hypothetical protein